MLSVSRSSLPPLIDRPPFQNWFDLRPQRGAFPHNIFLSSARCPHAGKSGRAGTQERATLLRRAAAQPPPLSAPQVHSMKILKLARLPNGSKTITLLESRWNGAEYQSLTSRELYQFSARGGDDGGDAGGDDGGDVAAAVMGLEADGILCNDPKICLSVTVADCMPIFLAAGQWRALLHSGWAGTGILRCLLDELYRLTEESASLVLGPCISPANYEVSAARAELFATRFGANTTQGRNLDLRQANLSLLEHAPIKTTSHVWTDCTLANPDLYSYRRMGAGSFALMLALFPPAL